MGDNKNGGSGRSGRPATETSLGGTIEGFEKSALFGQMADRLMRGSNIGTGSGYDPILSDLLTASGYDGKPSVVSEQALDKAVAAGATEMWRQTGNADYAEQFKTGEMFVGSGIYGNGLYTGYGEKGKQVASLYAGGQAGMLRMALSKKARTVDHDTLKKEWERDQDRFDAEMTRVWRAAEKAKSPDAERLYYRRKAMNTVLDDIGRYAVLRGYDAITAPNRGELVLLNRTKVKVQR